MKRHPALCLSSILKYAFTRYGMLWLGLGIVVLMSLAALLAPWLAPYDPTEFHRHAILKPPSAQYLLGTDALYCPVCCMGDEYLYGWGSSLSAFPY